MRFKKYMVRLIIVLFVVLNYISFCYADASKTNANEQFSYRRRNLGSGKRNPSRGKFR